MDKLWNQNHLYTVEEYNKEKHLLKSYMSELVFFYTTQVYNKLTSLIPRVSLQENIKSDRDDLIQLIKSISL